MQIRESLLATGVNHGDKFLAEARLRLKIEHAWVITFSAMCTWLSTTWLHVASMLTAWGSRTEDHTNGWGVWGLNLSGRRVYCEFFTIALVVDTVAASLGVQNIPHRSHLAFLFRDVPRVGNRIHCMVRWLRGRITCVSA